MSECQVGYHPMGRVCVPCPNGVCVGGRSKLYIIIHHLVFMYVSFSL